MSTLSRPELGRISLKITLIKTSLLPLALKMLKLAEIPTQTLNLLCYKGLHKSVSVSVDYACSIELSIKSKSVIYQNFVLSW